MPVDALSLDELETLKALPSTRSLGAALDKLREEAIEVALEVTHMADGRAKDVDVAREVTDLVVALAGLEEAAPGLFELVRQLVPGKLARLRAEFRPGAAVVD